METHESIALVEIRAVSLIDCRGDRIEPPSTGKDLVKASRRVVKRYRDGGLKVQAGMSGGTMAATWAVGFGSTVAISPSFHGASAAGSNLLLASGTLRVAAPAVAVGSVVRSLRNNAVDKEIQARYARFPLSLQAHEKTRPVAFFPLTPSPQRVEIVYHDGLDARTLTIDVATLLAGLYLPELDCVTDDCSDTRRQAWASAGTDPAPAAEVAPPGARWLIPLSVPATRGATGWPEARTMTTSGDRRRGRLGRRRRAIGEPRDSTARARLMKPRAIRSRRVSLYTRPPRSFRHSKAMRSSRADWLKRERRSSGGSARRH